MPTQGRSGKPTTRRYSVQEKASAVRMVRSLRAETGMTHGAVRRVAARLVGFQTALKDRLRGKRIRFTNAERALLARKAKAVGRKALLELETIVSPDTLLR